MTYNPKTGRIMPDYYPMYQFNFPPEMSVEGPGFIVVLDKKFVLDVLKEKMEMEGLR